MQHLWKFVHIYFKNSACRSYYKKSVCTTIIWPFNLYEGDDLLLQYQLKMEDAPVLRLLDVIIIQGLEARASDIHLEPGTDLNRIRYRIDGVLQQAQRISMERHTALVSCVKLMAGMDIAEKRKPQDGRAQVTHEGKRIDLRLSSLPTIHGEKIVIRVLDSGSNQLCLDDMGFTEENLTRYRSIYRSSYGLVLITGPTGSGKTTTLYATLQELNRPERNIITIEDPVEYSMDGMNQVALNTKIGMTFASGLRSILRQDNGSSIPIQYMGKLSNITTKCCID
jgi:type IV pilus assembly protein PilB